MNLLRLWIIMMVLAGALTGYVVSSGIGVVFCGVDSLPLVGKMWWTPIVMLVFLLAFRVMFHKELHGGIAKDNQEPSDKEQK